MYVRTEALLMCIHRLQTFTNQTNRLDHRHAQARQTDLTTDMHKPDKQTSNLPC